MNFRYEQKKISDGYHMVIGCDEVGRGCLAGPVVAGAVIMNLETWDMKQGVRDSKLLSVKKREELSSIIKEQALAWSIGQVSQEIVDEINIHNATLLAMRKAVEGLLFSHVVQAHGLPQKKKQAEGLHYKGTKRPFLVIDGKFTIPNFDIDQEAVVDGDNKILSIAAASIIAKVYRDRLMTKIHQDYPIYNFAQHKGYGTLFHRTMILQNGLSSVHRKSFCKNLRSI
ncbi:MAG: ribonuclease HII [Candidatus Doudnabacteria bacterium]|nr:ribonuclease HII [Candidatus Doudnabacteria bacterium]